MQIGMRQLGILLTGGALAAGVGLAGILAAEVLSERDRQRQRMAAGLCEEELRVGSTTRTHEIYEFLFEGSIRQNIFKLHIINILVSDFF